METPCWDELGEDEKEETDSGFAGKCALNQIEGHHHYLLNLNQHVFLNYHQRTSDDGIVKVNLQRYFKYNLINSPS